MISASNPDSPVDIFVSSVITAYSGYALTKFDPLTQVPTDEKLAPAIRYVGWGLIGLSVYQLYRFFAANKGG